MDFSFPPVTLKDVLKKNGYIRGPFGSALKRADMKETGIPVYEQQHAISNTRTFRYFIDNEKYDTLKRFSVQENDLIISCSGTIGKISIINKNDPIGIISQALLILRPEYSKVSHDYLYYFLSSKKGHHSLIQASHGSVQVNIAPRNVVEQITFNLPKPEEQKKIVLILKTLDEKITLNTAMNQTLEAMAQTIFKSWFVDFEPFNEGKFIESELGMIPEGWGTGTFDQIIDNYDSKRIPLSKTEREQRQGKFPYYGASSAIDYIDDYIFDGIYVLVGEDGTVITDKGTPVLQYVWGKFWVNNHTHILKAKKYFCEEYIYLLLKQTNVMNLVTGAVQPKINQKNMNSIKVILPDSNTLKKFTDTIQPLFERIRNNSDETKTLTALRDTLLPKLMSGEVRV